MEFLCPPSEELQKLINVIPPVGSKSSSFEEWSADFVATMEAAIELVKSGHVGNPVFSAGAQDAKIEDQK